MNASPHARRTAPMNDPPPALLPARLHGPIAAGQAVGEACAMQWRNVGPSRLAVSAVGLGCNNFGARCDVALTGAVGHKALDCGITLFDTADVYGGRGGSERMLGEILGPRRKDIVLATKFGAAMDDAGRLQGASRRYIMQAVE